MKMSKKKMYSIIAIAVAVVGSVVIFAGGSDSSLDNGMPVGVQVVNRDTIGSSVTAIGEVFLLDSESLFINNSLEVKEVLVRENDVVTEGQPLILFNTNTRERERERERLETDLREAQLNLRNSEVALEQALRPPTQAELENARLNVSRAEGSILEAELALTRLDGEVSEGRRYLEQQQRAVEQEQRSLEQRQRVLEQRQNALEDAKENFNNMQLLFNVGGVTQTELDTAERAVETAELDARTIENEIINNKANIQNLLSNIKNREETLARTEMQRRQIEQNITTAHYSLNHAKINLSELENTLTNPNTISTIEQRRIEVDRMRLAVERAQNSINNFNDVKEVLSSSVAGTVTNVSVTNGQVAVAGNSLVEISNARNYVVRAFVNERNAGQIRAGQEVIIEGSILGNETISGQVRTVGTVAQTRQVSGVSERVVPVEISIDQEYELLIPGVTVDVTITTEVRENVLAIPILSTLSQRDGTTKVFVVNSDNILEEREVTVGVFADMLVEVYGLEEGEVIVSQPTHDMVTGMTVTPIPLEERGAIDPQIQITF